MEGEWKQEKKSYMNRITKGMWIDFKTPKRKSILIDSGHEKGNKTINLGQMFESLPFPMRLSWKTMKADLFHLHHLHPSLPNTRLRAPIRTRIIDVASIKDPLRPLTSE